jgi:AcrR family transcriptional regulator
VTRQRDAERSRTVILQAAVELFAERGFAATTMQDIARAAGVARATPGYFFGSKEALYDAVLRHVHDERSQALNLACAPLREWAADRAAGSEALRAALEAAIDGYVAFLRRRPEFARLIEWEALAEATQLRDEPSSSLSDAFRRVHRVRRERGLRDFDVQVVVVAVVSLCFLPVAHASTFRAGGGIDPLAPRFHARYRTQVVEAVLAMLGG